MPRGVEQQAADFITQRRAAGLTKARHPNASRRQTRCEAGELRALPRPLPTFEHNQTAVRHRYPSVMMELAAPFRMPSRIHWFTCTITLSKFSLATITRW